MTVTSFARRDTGSIPSRCGRPPRPLPACRPCTPSPARSATRNRRGDASRGAKVERHEIRRGAVWRWRAARARAEHIARHAGPVVADANALPAAVFASTSMLVAPASRRSDQLLTTDAGPRTTRRPRYVGDRGRKTRCAQLWGRPRRGSEAVSVGARITQARRCSAISRARFLSSRTGEGSVREVQIPRCAGMTSLRGRRSASTATATTHPPSRLRRFHRVHAPRRPATRTIPGPARGAATMPIEGSDESAPRVADGEPRAEIEYSMSLETSPRKRRAATAVGAAPSRVLPLPPPLRRADADFHPGERHARSQRGRKPDVALRAGGTTGRRGTAPDRAARL